MDFNSLFSAKTKHLGTKIGEKKIHKSDTKPSENFSIEYCNKSKRDEKITNNFKN